MTCANSDKYYRVHKYHFSYELKNKTGNLLYILTTSGNLLRKMQANFLNKSGRFMNGIFNTKMTGKNYKNHYIGIQNKHVYFT